jgi:hypothetical protein
MVCPPWLTIDQGSIEACELAHTWQKIAARLSPQSITMLLGMGGRPLQVKFGAYLALGYLPQRERHRDQSQTGTSLEFPVNPGYLECSRF